MITKDWLEKRRKSQDIIDTHKFKELSTLTSQELFSKFIEIWNFHESTGLKQQRSISDKINARIELLEKLKKFQIKS